MRRDGSKLATLLAEVAPEVEFPPTPQLSPAVRRRIESGPLPVGRIHLPRTRAPVWRLLATAACVLIVVLGVTLTLSATARRAVADLLGIVGIHITFDEDAGAGLDPEPDLRLGERVDLATARDRAGFSVAVPGRDVTKGLGRAVYYDPAVGSTGMVSLVYPPAADRLAELDLLVTQFRAAVDQAYLKKLSVTEGGVVYTSVGPEPAFWVGHRHLLYYVTGEIEPVEESARLAGKVLLWEEGGVTYRVEGAPSLRAALRVAHGLR
jgi:hypothetical protein